MRTINPYWSKKPRESIQTKVERRKNRREKKTYLEESHTFDLFEGDVKIGPEIEMTGEMASKANFQLRMDYMGEVEAAYPGDPANSMRRWKPRRPAE